jgi:hypothetical protein
VEFVLVETILVGDPLYPGIKKDNNFGSK